MTKYLCYLLVLIPIVVSLLEIEYWPFTKYPMYTWSLEEWGIPAYSIAFENGAGEITEWPEELGAGLAVKKIFSYRTAISLRQGKKEWIDRYISDFCNEFEVRRNFSEKFKKILVFKKQFRHKETNINLVNSSIIYERDIGRKVE